MKMLRLVQIQLIFPLFVIASVKELPDNLIPVEYRLEIITNLGDEDDSFNFNGSVLIHMICITPTDSVILHSKNLVIDDEKTTLKCLNETADNPAVSETSQDVENDFLTIKLSQTLQADHHYELELHFGADLVEEMVGYYRSSYLSENDQKLWLAVTYFKPNNARRAFPCFDGLNFKAKFTISLGHTTNYRSVSNMPLLKTEKMNNKSGWEWDRFQTSPPMATYTVGYAVTGYNNEEIQPERNPLKVPLSVWGADDIINSEFTQRAMEFSAYFLYIFETDLKIKYHLPKLDMITIPNYPVPVMESWGLITWQEDYLVQVTMAILALNSEVLGVVADQMVRQIFGNLVTVKSWRDIWFVDGFGAYISPFVVDTAEQGFGWLNSEITDNYISVFNTDSLQSAQPISLPKNQSEGIFKTVAASTGKKIALLVRMISHIVGNAILRKIVQQYLEIYKYKNAGSHELLDLTTQYSPFQKVHIKYAIRSWVKQAGFPLITVTRDYKRGILQVKQERFFTDSRLLGKSKTRWWIPLTYTTECELQFNRTAPEEWLSPSMDVIYMTTTMSSADWVIFNLGASGLYLVDYDAENWHLISNYLRKPYFDRIPVMNRVILIESAARMAWVGRLEYSIFLDMIMYVQKDEDLQPAYAAVSRIYDIHILLKRMPIHEKFKKYVGSIFKGKEQATLMAKEQMTTNMVNHGRMISDACKYSTESCVKGPIYPQRRSMMTYILTSLRHLTEMLCNGKATTQYSWTEYVESIEIPIRKMDILLSFSCCRNSTLLQEYLEGALNEPDFASEEILPVIIAVMKSDVAFDLLKKFLSDNIKTIYERISPNVRELSLVISELAHHIVSEEELTWLKTFIDTNQEYLQDIQRETDESLEVAMLNLQWYQKRYGALESYFNER